MTPQLRAELARRWADTALDEHASIASFARHILELLALGAPSHLVRAAQQAMAEEIDHAERCFQLASRFAGEPLGPGPLQATEAIRSTPSGILEAVAREGCVNETASVGAAAAVLALTTDAQCRATLERIVADETRHAQLAWATLRWGWDAWPEARPAIQAVFAGLPEAAPLGELAPDEALASFGVLDPESERIAAAQAVWEVVVPAARSGVWQP